jgi:hypothetical protein
MITFNTRISVQFIEICSVGGADTSIGILDRVIRATFDHLRVIFWSLVIRHARTYPSRVIFRRKLLTHQNAAASFSPHLMVIRSWTFSKALTLKLKRLVRTN